MLQAVERDWRAWNATGGAEDEPRFASRARDAAAMRLPCVGGSAANKGCKGEPVLVWHLPALLAAKPPTIPPTVHYCSQFCVDPQCAGPPLQALYDETLYWCATHSRLHACDGVCRNTRFATAHGVEVCALSGNVLVATPLVNSFGDGTTVAAGQAGSNNNVRAQNVVPANEIDALLHASQIASTLKRPSQSAHSTDSNAEGSSRSDDPDVPRSGMFSDLHHENSFADGASGPLTQVYTHAYGCAQRLLVGEEVAALAAAAEARDVREAQHAVR